MAYCQRARSTGVACRTQLTWPSFTPLLTAASTHAAAHELRPTIGVIRAPVSVSLEQHRTPKEYRAALTQVHAVSEDMGTLPTRHPTLDCSTRPNGRAQGTWRSEVTVVAQHAWHYGVRVSSCPLTPRLPVTSARW